MKGIDEGDKNISDYMNVCRRDSELGICVRKIIKLMLSSDFVKPLKYFNIYTLCICVSIRLRGTKLWHTQTCLSRMLLDPTANLVALSHLS